MASDTNDPELDRRALFVRVIVAAAAGVAAVVALPPVAFLLAPVFRKAPRRWRRVGQAADFAAGTTTQVEYEDPSPLPWAGVTARTAAWLRCTAPGEFVAFSVNCRHLGCPVRWIDSAELFLCPCHGGVYAADGSVAAGPPPAPLERLDVRVRDGHVEIRTAEITLS
jgi:menaquinol-cytochrome c reductase iron-sulfur subunit